jgi:hypothetical protein
MARPNSAPRVDAAERDAPAMELRALGATFRQIAERLGVSVSTAHKCVDRGLAATRQEPSAKLRILERERLDHLQRETARVLAAAHVVVQGGKVVVDEDTGQPLVDHGPRLAAVNTLLRVMERRAKLEGLDAPTRHDISARFHTIDELDREIAELENLLGERAEKEGVDLYQRKREQANRLVEDLAGQVGWDIEERQQVHDRVLGFWTAWKDDQRALRDVPGFIAASLDMAVMILALPPAQAELLADQIERHLLERTR